MADHLAILISAFAQATFELSWPQALELVKTTTG
jgi:hypothetical protein